MGYTRDSLYGAIGSDVERVTRTGGQDCGVYIQRCGSSGVRSQWHNVSTDQALSLNSYLAVLGAQNILKCQNTSC